VRRVPPVRRRATERASSLTRAALVLACGCAREARRGPVAWLVIEAADRDQDSVVALDFARVEPDSVVARSVRSGAWLMLGIDVLAAPDRIRVQVPGACPVTVSSSELAPDAADHRRLRQRVEVHGPPHPRDLGYDAPFVLEAVAVCPEPSGGRVAWRQVSGPPLRDVRTDPGGLRFEARTAAAGDLLLDAPSRGIVPVSPRTSAAIVLEAGWRPSRGASPVAWRRVELASASRARGLPNVGVDEGVLLAGPGWSVTTAPRDAAASLQRSGALTRLIPDVAGPWLLRDATGQTLSLRAGRYDETPLDCGRASCHGPIADAAQSSPMTAALRRLMGDEPVTRGDVACALACHATGEPGTQDGGFTDGIRGLDLGTGWSSLPRGARRLGGVTCLGCHGPSAIPESSASWAILRADVCATCHDAPPTYGHVAAWRASRMARSDADGRARTDVKCARCHTTSGFLASVGDGRVGRASPPGVGPGGIACAACHASHDAHAARGAPDEEHLLRDVPLPDLFRGAPAGRSRICVRCHAPVASFADTPGGPLPPPASAAAIWAGRGGVDPATGAPLAAPSVHGAVDGGCIGCHSAGPSGLERGAGHAFKADDAACAGCHPTGPPDSDAIGRQLHDRAASVLARLIATSAVIAAGRPRHAETLTLTNDRIGRAAYDALLVLEDPAAAVHNAPFARALLEAAGRASRGARGEGR